MKGTLTANRRSYKVQTESITNNAIVTFFPSRPSTPPSSTLSP